MKKIITLLFTIMLLTACSETTTNNYKFIGESKHWEAEYIYKGTETWRDNNGTKTYSNKDTYELVLKYKGTLKELSSMKKLEYSFKTIYSGGERTEEFTEPPRKLTFKSVGSSEGSAKVNEDEVIQVHVKWNEAEESFELHNKNK